MRIQEVQGTGNSAEQEKIRTVILPLGIFPAGRVEITLTFIGAAGLSLPNLIFSKKL